MSNPFLPRFLRRFFVFLGCFFGCLVLASILDSLFLILVTISTVVVVPVYFNMKDNKEKASCIEMIRRKYNQENVFAIDAYHPNLEWGYLSLTSQAFIFVPKKGDIIYIALDAVTNYGSTAIGTGEFATTTSSVGNTGMSISSTREVKSPIFYVNVNEEAYYWHTKKNSKMFDAVQKLQGKDPGKLKSNY
ncbi:hypothetical protein EKA14_05445 [Bacillus mycoides]|nr:hypothetical protein IEQ_02790 [Bacillus cereus BAG6X1-2]RWS45202.1 hypothetical protein EKA14_05445 [Bacillus mycoides]